MSGTSLHDRLEELIRVEQEEVGLLDRADEDAHEAEWLTMLAEVKQLERWDDEDDEWSSAIAEAFPTRSGSHEKYGVAMRMVSSRRSKGQLVALVNWLLVTGAKIDPRPRCVKCGRKWEPVEGVDATIEPCGVCIGTVRFICPSCERSWKGQEATSRTCECGYVGMPKRAQRLRATEDGGSVAGGGGSVAGDGGSVAGGGGSVTGGGS